MQARPCTVALDAFYWTRLCGTAWIWRQSDTHLENAAAFLLRDCEVTRESTNNDYAADRRPACILEELCDTPCPGHAIVLVTCLDSSQHYVSRGFEIFSPGKQWDQNSRLGRHCHFPRLPYALSSRLVYTASRAHLRGNSAGGQTHHPCPTRVSLTLEVHANTGVVSDGLSQGGERRRRRYHGKMMMRIAWLSPLAYGIHLARMHHIG
jgi:hypothetical protein